jgi:hypothetical protein
MERVARMRRLASIASNLAAALCPKCDYALTGLAGSICPECGVECTPALLERARRRRRVTALAVMACAMYAPFSWLLWIDYPWSGYHWLWLRMGPILPGLPATILLRIFGWRMPESIEMLCMVAFTALALLLFTWLGSRSRRWLIVTAIVVFALSCYNGWVGYILFRI